YSGVDEDDYSCSIYTQQDAYDSIFYVIDQITFNNRAHSGKIKIYFNSDTDIQECKDWHILGSDCIILKPQELASKNTEVKLNSSFFNLEFYRLIQVKISFKLKGVALQTIHARELPDCYAFQNTFEDLNTVAECLFSLVNGDDMFATFAQIQQKSMLVWTFSRLYLYSFIILFIYMILSLFIALITDAYETIKKYQQNGFLATDLHEFLKDCGNVSYRNEQTSAPFICCCRRSALIKNKISSLATDEMTWRIQSSNVLTCATLGNMGDFLTHGAAPVGIQLP
ncbi:UNVERIFIED_CONTAM: hypothetical protein H355_012966, partial [Colinus virginianus]